jgi:uncharacterized lipoprotein YmbA
MIARSGRCRVMRLPIAVLIGLTLCTGCIGRSDPARFYVLTEVPRSTVAAPSAEPGRGAAVGVGPVGLPGYLDRIQIVTRRGAQLEVAEFDRWGEPLSEGVSRAIAVHLAALLQTDRIAVFPWPAARTIEHQVVVDVTRFDGVVGGDVLLEARWRIFGQDRKELVLRYSAVREATGESGYLALVAAMSRSVGALSREIADSVKMLRAQPAR